MTKEELRAIRECHQKTSPRPWSQFTDENGDEWLVMDEGHRFYMGNIEGTCSTCYHNADFIIAAHDCDIPALLAEVERLQAIVNQLPAPAHCDENHTVGMSAVEERG